jgi:hypothetical protein
MVFVMTTALKRFLIFWTETPMTNFWEASFVCTLIVTSNGGGGGGEKSVALSPQANKTDLETATFPQNLVPTFVDRGVSRGQHGGSPTVVHLSFLDI